MTQETLSLVIGEELADGQSINYVLQALVNGLLHNQTKYGKLIDEYQQIFDYVSRSLIDIQYTVKQMESIVQDEFFLKNNTDNVER